MTIFNSEQWSNNLFQSADLGDQRRVKRLAKVTAQWASNTGCSMAKSCQGDLAQLEGSYRLIRNPQVNAEHFRSAAFHQVAQSAPEQTELWALEDTTSLSYRHGVSTELGKLGKTSDQARGWWVHSALLVNGQTGSTLGLVHQEYWLRPDDPNIADEKESGKWNNTAQLCRQRLGTQMSQVIAVCDREADFGSYLADKLQHKERFVVRAQHDRCLESSCDFHKLLAALDAQPVVDSYTLTVAQKGMKTAKGARKNRPKRQATIQVKTCPVVLKTAQGPLSVNAVYAQEQGDDEARVNWLLLTTEPIDTPEQIRHIIYIYSNRWRIEEFHKAWKTGAGAERQRMTAPEHLEKAVSILAFIAVRLLQLKEVLMCTLLNSIHQPEPAKSSNQPLLASEFLSPAELSVLAHLSPAKATQDSNWAYHVIAKLGGFTDSKKTGIASWQTIWDGWDKLQTLVEGYQLAETLKGK